MKCPHCGHEITTTKRRTKPAEISEPVDTRLLSDAELYAHCKATAPVEDCRFFAAAIGRQLGKDDPLYAAAYGLAIDAQHMKRADVYARLTALQDTWRRRPTPELDQEFERMREQIKARAERKAAADAFRRQRAELISDVQCFGERYSASRPYYGYDSIQQVQSGIYARVRELVQRCRVLYPNAPALAKPEDPAVEKAA